MDGETHPPGGTGSGSAPAAMAPPVGPPPPHPSAPDTPMSAPTPLQAPSTTSSAAASRKSSLRSNAPPSSSASTTRIRKGLLSRAGSEAEDRSSRAASAAHNQLTTDDDDDELMISDSGPMPRRFASQNRGPMQTANSSRQSSQSSLPLSSWGSTALASGSQRGSAAAPPHSPSHPSSSSSSIASGNRSGSGDASEGASSAGGVSLGRAMSVSSVSSVNSTSSLEAVPFREAPMGNVRLGFGGANPSFRNAGRRNNPYGPLAMASQPRSNQQDFAQASQSQHNDISAASIDLMAPPMSDTTPLAPADATAASRAPTSDRHRGVPKPASDAWMYRVGPGMRTNKPKAPSGAPEEPSDPSSEDLQSSSSPAKRSRDVLRQKFAKGAGRLGIKANIVTGLGPSASDLSTAFNPLDSSEDELNMVPPMRTPLPRSSSYFTSAPHTAGSTTGTPLHPSLTPVPADFRTSSVTNAPLFVPKHPEDSYATQEPGLTITPDVDEEGPQTTFNAGADISANSFLTAEASGTDAARNARRRSSATHKPVLLRAESSSEAFDRVASPGLGIDDSSVVDASPARPALYTLSSANARAKNTPAVDLIQASNGSASSPQPPTPAELVRMEAQAGIASLPDSPSEPSPVPASYSPAAADEAVSNRRMRDFPSQPKLRRPSSGAGSEASLGVGPSAGTSRRPDSLHRQRLWSNSKRPAILRARTSESSISRRSHSLDRNRSSPAPQSPVEGPLSDAHYGRSGTHSKSSSCSTAQGNESANRAPPHVSVILEDDDGGVNGDQLERSTVHGAEKMSPASPATSGLDGDYQMALSPPGGGMLPLAVRPNPHSRSASPASQLARSPETIRVGPSRISDSLYGRSPASISLLRSPRLQPSSASIGSDRPSTPSQSRTTSTRGPNDFHFGETLGEGSYSTVLEAWDLLSGPSPKDPSVVDPNATSAAAAMVGSESARKRRRRIDLTGRKSYAVKVVDKVHILKQGKQKYVAIEKEALSRMIQCPGVVTLYWTFQDRESLYFVLELASNGELLNFIRKHGSFDAASARYYAAQLADTIDAMHRAGVVHRDVKPENILIDAAHRIKITDFGSAKIVHAVGESDVLTAKASAAQTPPPPQQTRAASFVGTAEYVSPELLVEKAQPAGKPADWWAFGCVLFQMLAGRPPFKGVNEYQTLQKVKNREFTFPQGFPDDAEELINHLLVLDPAERPSATEIKAHRFFTGVDFDALWRVEAPEIKTGLVQPVPMPQRREFGNTSDFSFDEGFVSSSDSQAYNGDTQSIDNQPHGGAEESSLSLDATSRSGADDADDSDMSDASSNVRDPRGEQRLPRRQSGLQRLADGFQSRFMSNAGGAGTSPLPQGTNTAPRRKMASMSIDAAQPSENGNGGANYTGTRGSRPFARSVQGTGGLSHSPSPTVREQQSQGGGDGLASAVGLQQSWTALLLPKELMLYSTPVAQRKTGAGKMFTKRRQLVLTDFPRLLCVKETATALKVKSEVILALPSKAGGSDASAALDPAAASSLTASHGGVEFERSSDQRASVRLDPEGGEEDEGAVALAQERPLQQAIPNLLTGVDFKGGKSFTIRVNNGRTFLYETLSGDASALVRYIQEARKPSA